MNTPVIEPLCYERLYDGSGAHIGWLYPPLMVQNQLTAEFHNQKACRPAGITLNADPERDNLGLIYLVPLGLPPVGPIPTEVLGALVWTIDAGQAVSVHADREDTAQTLVDFLKIFAGGGHA